MSVEAPRAPAEPIPRTASPIRLSRIGGAGTLAWRVLAIQVVLGVVAVAVPLDLTGPVTTVMVLLGLAAVAVGIRRNRPQPAVGWWLLFSAGATSLLAVMVMMASVGFEVLPADGVRSPVPAPTPLSSGVFALSYLLSVAGFTLVGRPRGSRSGWIDLLDAATVAAAVFPLLWIVVIDPLTTMAGARPMSLMSPVVSVLALVLAGKLGFSVGLRNWSAVWLIVGAGSLLAMNVALVLPAQFEVSGVAAVAVTFIWVGFPVAAGLAALHPSVVAATTPPRRPDTDSVRRAMVLGSLAVLVPMGLVLERVIIEDDRLAEPGDVAALLGPVVVVAVLLVVRLATVAHVASRRAAELARQTQALDLAAREQEALRQQLTYRALHDPLTGLANRVVLAERLEWTLTRRSGTGRHALLLVDLDGFKDVNDTLGHQVGDELLILVAHRVLPLVPEDGLLARLGGDEFAVLLGDVADAEAAEAWAEQLLRALRRPFTIDGRTHFQTASIGIAVLDSAEGQATSSSALRFADLALHAAKRTGRDQSCRFEPAMLEAQENHSRLSAGLRRALVADEFHLHYQPVVELATGEMRAVEALLRWEPPGEALVPPERFVPVAEETGLINEIGGWVLRHACARALPWYTTRKIALAVNVSGRQLVSGDLARTVRDALAATNLPPEALIIELTETSLLASATVDRAVAQLDDLRRQGVRVAIDDFGTGYSSLSYLARLPVDILKIDRSFIVSGEGARREDWSFARAITELGRALRLTIVAEGIETTEQADTLRQLDCQLGQGYHFSRPVAPERIDRMLGLQVPVGTSG